MNSKFLPLKIQNFVMKTLCCAFGRKGGEAGYQGVNSMDLGEVRGSLGGYFGMLGDHLGSLRESNQVL